MLILLGGAILVAIIVGIALKNLATNQGNNATTNIQCTIQDCTTCKTTDGCKLTKIDTTTIDGSSANTACDATEQTLFKKCELK